MKKLFLAAALLLGITSQHALAQNYDLTHSSVILPGGAVQIPLPQLFQQATIDKGISVNATGAPCNGSGDDAAKLNTYMATLTNGGTIDIPAGQQCVISSANLNIPAGVRLVGMTEPRQNAYGPITVAAIIVDPTKTITLQKGSGLYSLMVVRQNLLPNPSAAQAIAAVNAWGTDTSTGITIPANSGGQSLNNLFIVGFNTAIKSYSGNYTMFRIAGDDYNGIEVATAGDNAVIYDARFEPYYSLATDSGSGSWARPGTAFNFHDGDTLGSGGCVNCFSFMYANGIVMNNIGIMSVTDSSFEWNTASGNGVANAEGIRIVGAAAGVDVKQSYFSGFATAVSDEVGNEVSFRNLQINGWDNAAGAGFYLAGGSAPSAVLTITGTPTVGATVCAQIAGSTIVGTPVTPCYAVVTGDTLNTVAMGLAQQILKNQALVADRVAAYATNNTTTLYWPADQTNTVTASTTGSLTTSQAAGSAIAGSNGILTAPLMGETPPTRAFVVGNTASDANAWNITTPLLSNGTSPLPAGWLVWNHPVAGSVPHITLSGIQWSSINSTSQLTNCGTAPSFSHGFTTDAGGVVVEGTSATGCRITFTTPFPWTPRIHLTNWNNPTMVLIQDVDATGFTVINAQANNDTFSFTATP